MMRAFLGFRAIIGSRADLEFLVEYVRFECTMELLARSSMRGTSEKYSFQNRWHQSMSQAWILVQAGRPMCAKLTRSSTTKNSMVSTDPGARGRRSCEAQSNFFGILERLTSELFAPTSCTETLRAAHTLELSSLRCGSRERGEVLRTCRPPGST